MFYHRVHSWPAGLIGMPNPLHSDGLVDYEDVLGDVTLGRERCSGTRSEIGSELIHMG